MSEMKTCSKCGIEYPATTEYFAAAKAQKSGLYPSCKVCQRARGREYYRAHSKEIIARTGQNQHNHPERNNRYSDKWRAAHREQFLAASQRRSAEWRENNRDKDRAASTRWQKENHSAYRAIQQRARVLRQNCEGDYTAEQWESVKVMFDYRCPRCGKREPEISLTVDHIIPLSQGGRGDIGNIQPLCMPCNAAKGARVVIDYRVGLQTLEMAQQYSLYSLE